MGYSLGGLGFLSEHPGGAKRFLGYKLWCPGVSQGAWAFSGATLGGLGLLGAILGVGFLGYNPEGVGKLQGGAQSFSVQSGGPNISQGNVDSH